MARRRETTKDFEALNRLWDSGFITDRELRNIHKRVNKAREKRSKELRKIIQKVM